LLRSLNTREYFVASRTQYVNLFYSKTKWIEIVCGEARETKQKNETKLVYLYLFLILAFMCSPSFIHFILSYIRVIKLRRKKATGYKKSIREFI
jgi:hypothetical protein